LNEYEGAVILISHDRRLIEGCADRLVLVADGRATAYDGDLDDYRKLVLGAPDRSAGSRGARGSKADARRESAARRESLKPLKDAMDRAEREMADLRARIANIDAALAAPGLFAKNAAKGNTLSKDRATAARALEKAEHRWIEAAERYERESTAE
jgi:ATP-binding cassette subfamily F protein 3